MSLTAEFLWTLSLTVLVTIAIVGIVRFRTPDYTQPIVMFAAVIYLGFLLPAEPFALGEDVNSRIWPYTFANIDDAMTSALFCVVIASVMYAIGYLPRRRSRGAAADTLASGAVDGVVNSRKLLWGSTILTIIALAVVGTGIQLAGGVTTYFSGLGDRTRLTQGLNFFFFFVNVPLSICLVYWTICVGRRKWPGLWYWIYLLAALGFASILGQKSNLYVFIVAMTLIYNLRWRRLGIPLISFGAIAFFALLILYSRFTREYLVVGTFTTLDFRDPSTFTNALQYELGGNFMQLQTLSIVIDGVNTNRLDTLYGLSYVNIATQLIPRVLFPDKPLTSPGVFTLSFWPDRWLLGGTTIPPGLLGEMYMNFGVVGIGVGGLLLGLLHGSVYRRALRAAFDRTGSRRILFYGVLCAMTLHYIRGEFPLPTIFLAVLYLPAHLLLGLCIQRSPVQTQHE